MPPPGVTPPPPPQPNPIKEQILAQARARILARAQARIAQRQQAQIQSQAPIAPQPTVPQASRAAPNDDVYSIDEHVAPPTGSDRQLPVRAGGSTADSTSPVLQALGDINPMTTSVPVADGRTPVQQLGDQASAFAHVLPAVANSAGAFIQRGVAPISDLPYRALGLGHPAADLAAENTAAAQQYTEEKTGANPIAKAAADVGGPLAAYAANPLFGAAMSGSNTEQDALQAGMPAWRAALAGAGSAALNTVAPYASKPFAAGAQQIAQATGRAAPIVQAGLEGVPQGAVFAAGQPAVTALAGGDAGQDVANAPETVGMASILNALFHAPAALARSPRAPTQPQAQVPEPRTEEPPSAPEPAAVSPEPARTPGDVAPAPSPENSPAAPHGTPEARFVKSPASADEAVQHSIDYANEQSGGKRPGPPVAILGHVYDNLPDGQAGRLIDYVPDEQAGPRGFKRLAYKFRLENGEEATYRSPQLIDAVSRGPESYEPVVVKRGANQTPPVETPAPVAEPSAARPAPQKMDAPAPEEPVVADHEDVPRPFERQPDGQVAEVQQLAQAAQERFAKEPAKPSMHQRWLDRELAKPNPDPEKVAAYRRMVDSSKRQEPAPVTERAPDATQDSNPSLPVAKESAGSTERAPSSLARPEPPRNTEPMAEDTQTVEHRAREYGLTREEARTVEGRQGATEHPDIPEHVRSTAEFIAGKKHFESHDQWKQWWDSLPEGMRRGTRELTGTGEHVTTTDEQGHVVAAGQRPVSVPPSRHVQVSNIAGVNRSLEMAVRPLDANANISYTAGTEAKGNVETLPRYYVGQVTDRNAPPGARGKWVVLDWNPNNDEHVKQARGQRVPFQDIPTLKAIGGNSKTGLVKSNIYESYSDAKNAALDIVANTKRNRDFSMASKPVEQTAREGLTENDPVAPDDIKSGRARFVTREQLTEENPDAVYRQGEGEKYRYDKSVDKLIAELESQRAAGKSPAEIAADPNLASTIKAIEGLGKNIHRYGGTVDWLNATADAIERLAKTLLRVMRKAAGLPAKKLSDMHRTVTQVLNRIKAGKAEVTPEFQDRAARYADEGSDPEKLRARLQQIRETGRERSPLKTQLIQGLRWARAFKRGAHSEFRHLDFSKPQDAAFANALRLAVHPDDAARTQAALALADVTQPLAGNAEHYRLFSDKLVMDDLVQSIDDGTYTENSVIPFTGKRLADGGEEAIRAAKVAIDKEVEGNKTVADAVKKFRETWFDEVSGPLAAEGIIPAHLADPERPYFHRQVLEHYSDEATAEVRGTPKNVRPNGARPSSFMRRTGAKGDYNPAFEEAMLQSMADAFKRLNQRRFERQVDRFSKHQDAIDHNYEHNSDLFEHEVDDGKPNVTRGIAALGKELAGGLIPPKKYGRYQDLLDAMKRGEDMSNHEELPQFLGDAARSRDYLAQKLLAHSLGNEFRDPRDVAKSAPDGYVPVMLDDGRVFRPVKTIPDDLAGQIKAEGELMVKSKNIADALALGQSKPPRLLPERYAKQIGESLAPRPESNAVQKLAGRIARWALKNPLSLPAYLALNATSNASMAFISNPLVFRKAAQATKLLTKLHYGAQLLPAEKALLDKLVEHRVIEQHFVGQMDDQAKAALGRLARHSKRAGFSANNWQDRLQWLGSLYDSKVSRPLSAMVDDIPKVAEYLHQLDVENGTFSRPVNDVFGQKYGAARKAQVERANGPEETAALHARAYGDYGAISPLGDAARRSILPFYSWVEVEAKWISNLLRNTVSKDLISSGAELTKLAAKIAAVHYAIGAFNSATHSDETKRKAEEAGIDPVNNLILGQTPDGRVRYIPAPVVTSDIMKRIGLGDWYNKFRDVNGESSTETVGSLFRQAPQVALAQQIGSANPLFLAPAEIASGVRPNTRTGGVSAMQPGDTTRTLLGGLGARQAGGMIDDQPKPSWSPLDLISRATDPEDTQYYKSKQLVQDWKAKVDPDNASAGSGDPRSLGAQALHDMKAALKLHDTDRAVQALNSFYYEMTGDKGPANVKQSIAAMAPSEGLGPKKAEFLASLTDSERATWDAANAEFEKWSDPYHNPELAKVLSIAASADQSKYHEQTRIYANEKGAEFAAGRKDGTANFDTGIPARMFSKFDEAGKKMDKLKATDAAAKFRERARASFAPALPETERR